MDTSFWQKLADAARDQGPDLWSTTARCRSFLLDYYGREHESEIALLANAVQLGIPAALLSDRNTIPLDALLAAKVGEMQARFFLTDEAARWAVEAWMFALNIPIPPIAPLPSPPDGPSGQPPAPPRPAILPRLLVAALLVAMAAGAIYLFRHRLDSSGNRPATPTPAQSSTWTQEQWDKATPRGTLIDDSVVFPPGSATMKDESKDMIKDALPKLERQTSFGLVVEAHVAPGDSGGDSTKDQAFSKQRAEEVKRFLVQECHVPEERILAKGLGSMQPPPHVSGQTQREWERLARTVSILLVEK